MLKENLKVISLVIAKPNRSHFTATENGYGKRTDMEEYRLTGRGGQGVISIQVSEAMVKWLAHFMWSLRMK